MKSIYGRRAIESVVALSQSSGGLTLAELSKVIGGPLSSSQRAMASLEADGLVLDQVVGTERRYAIDRRHPAADALVAFALRALPQQRALDLVLRATRAVQFAGRDERGYVVVLSRFAEPDDIARMSAAVDAINESRADATPIAILERRDVIDQLMASPALRDRGLRLTPVTGSAIRAFRDPYEHGSFEAPELGRLHPSLPTPSARAMGALARRHGLDRIAAFGSAVRTDFRPDSDVDVVVEAKPGIRLGIGDLLDIRRELERVFDRDVDVVNARAMLGEPRRRAEQEGVLLYGRP